VYHDPEGIQLMNPVLVLSLLLAQNAPAAPQVDWAKAKRVFDANCAGCHGPEGVGGKGPALAVPKLPRARTNEDLAAIIAGGIPGTVMPPSWHLGNEGVALCVAYVRKLGENATPPKVTGDIASGAALFKTKACGNCHNSGYGPDLSTIGARRTAASLRQSITDPSSEVSEDSLLVRVTTRQGNSVQGIRVNEDNFTIQIVELSGRFSSFRKDSLTKLDRRVGESPMPSYKTLFTDAELQDLVAYLASLRGEQ
jgi:cytochrome c oxidase cbb3-type subunit III